jgi:hypothetical protein
LELLQDLLLSPAKYPVLPPEGVLGIPDQSSAGKLRMVCGRKRNPEPSVLHTPRYLQKHANEREAWWRQGSGGDMGTRTILNPP